MLETTVRLPDGEIVKVSQGWNDFGSRGRIYLRRDGSTVFDGRPQAVEDGSLAVTSSPSLVGSSYPAGNDRRHPDFTVGNRAAQKHGATSPRTVDPIVDELVTTTLVAASFLDTPAFRATLEAWARAETRCALLAAYLDEHGLLDENGVPRPATRLMSQVESAAAKLRASLGLDPASRAAIESSLTSTAASSAALEAALDAGQQLLRDRVARTAEEVRA